MQRKQRSGGRGTLRLGFSSAGRMATVVVEATEPEPSGSIANPAASTSPSLSHRFLDSKFYLLVVVGETVTEEHLRRAIGNIELGIRSWDTNLIECNLDQELKLFVSRHSARFSPEVPEDERQRHFSLKLTEFEECALVAYICAVLTHVQQVFRYTFLKSKISIVMSSAFNPFGE
ncbi:hypothetical protein STEG23_011818, partial [Scotinomys teguina]